YITYLAARNIIVGVGYGKFTPEAQVTRAQFTKMVFGASGLDNSVLEGYKVSDFEDVSSNTWYASYVMWASKNGIANGVGDNKFDPDASITREQMTVMLHNFIKFSEVKLVSHSVEEFKDNELISSWAFDAVNYINSVSIIDGKGDGTFDPAKPATRAEAAKVVATFIQSLLK
ncbi:MAG: putative phosphoesterase, partial [Clostridiales bacterium]|nr:putative phosphoesterase [Clostridiales bacterium]